ncbi:SPOR domain-containing protein [Acidovorax sp. Leaf160]|uniref:SPOR domain-containing protein n=1 Tax=Acidovorax sp. Leaf160 TaxID=1736280 RepID=UPI0006FDFD2B|nr:SPOR domain-containing protein [Acidovorax sp. Leaf160]KQR50167.1 hypothetical protein ASF94_06725 [Acidovorax sp. Leaf160]
MQAHTAYAAQAAAVLAPRPAENTAMPALYRAALGSQHTERYLAFFQRQDDTGRTLPGWNAAAAFFTLGWMVFRQLWAPALVYLAAVEGVALLLFVLGHQWLGAPLPVLAGVTLAFWCAACVVPGLYGDAAMHAEVRKKITKALSASANLPQAVQLLARQAPTRKRLGWVIAAHAALAAVALLWWIAFPESFRPTDGASPTERAAPAQAVPAAAGVLATNTSAAAEAVAGEQSTTAPVTSSDPTSPATTATTATTANNAEAATTPLPAPAASAGAAAPNASANPAEPAPVAASSNPPGRTATPAVASTPAAAAAATGTIAAATAAAGSTATAGVPGAPPVPAASAEAAARPAGSQSAARLTRPTVLASAAATAAKATAPRARASAAAAAAAEPARRQLYINAGMFGDPDNARRAHARLREAGLPASTAQVRSTSGRVLTRVRAGPFTSAAEANAAMAQVQLLGLDAAPAQR